MSSIQAPEYSQALTDVGGTDGILEVASTVGYKVGAEAWLQGPLNSPESQFVRIAKIVDATHVGVVFIPEGMNDEKLRTGVVKYPSSVGNDCSSYPIGSTLSMPQQVVALPPTS